MKTNFTPLLLCAALGLSNQSICAQATETVTGILERSAASATYAAVFAVSPGSGDVIGYAIKTQSPAGKALTKYCLAGMPCKIDRAVLSEVSSTLLTGFNESPSVWFEITSFKGVGLDSAKLSPQNKVKTRHGAVHIDNENRLNHKGKPVQPTVEGNFSLSIVASYKIKQQDVLLLQNNGGSACPVQLRFATLDASGIRVTSEFGSCSDYYYPQQTINGISVAIADQDPSSKALKKIVFNYADGKVTQQP